MRPRRLRLENFTSFRGEQPPLDFTQLDLFVISGATGSGKTSLLDAMVFALYGTVPRMSDAHKELIALGRDRLSVVLDFECRGEAYRVTRVMNRGPKASQAQLEKLAGDGDGEPVADGVKAVEAAVQRVLGLSYEAFTQAVILPQNEFARFLKSAPKHRNAILRDLLRLSIYERMRERAEADQRALAAQLKTLEDTLVRAYADATPEAVAGLKQALAAAREMHRGLEPRVQRQQQAVAELRTRAAKTEELRRARTTLAGLELRALEIQADQSKISNARKAEAIVPRLEAAQLGRAAAERSEAAAQTAAKRAVAAIAAHATRQRLLETADAAAAGLPALDGRIEALAKAVALAGPVAHARLSAKEEAAGLARAQTEARAALAERGETEKRALTARKAREVAAAKAEATRVLAEAAELASQQAETALREAERHEVVAHLRRGLKAGEECPVCERPLKTAPKAIRSSLAAREAARATAHAARDAARLKLESARLTAEEARRAGDKAESDLTAASQRAQSTETASDDAARRAEAERRRLERLLTDLRALTQEADPVAAQAALRRDRERLATEREAARVAEAAGTAERAGAEAAAAAARQQAQDQNAQADAETARAEKAAHAAGFASVEAAGAAVLAASALRALEESVDRYGRERHSAEERVKALQAEIAGREVESEALERAEAELRRLDQDKEASAREESRLEQQLGELERRMTEAAERRREMDESRTRQSLMRQLALDLRIDGFQKYLLEETLRELLAGASRNLMRLTGRYGLEQQDDQFFVLDHDNAGERRRAETLSGGETFLASLALALELSEQVQRAAGAVRLDSLFIDEGFGALDAQTLEVVAQALEGLPIHGRMVGIVTHLPELTERIPSRVRVEKRPDGSRFALELG